MLRQDSSTTSVPKKSSVKGKTQTTHQQGLELQQQLQRLEEIIVLEGFKLPMTSRTIIDDDQLLTQLLTIERSIPDCIKDAETLLERREDILNDARQKAQEIIQQAERRAAQIADELTIIKQAEIEAQELRKQVQDEVDQIRRQNFSEIERVRRQTQQEVDSLRKSARMECEQIHRESDRYADSVLGELEHNLSAMIKVIQNGRRHINTHSAAAVPQQNLSEGQVVSAKGRPQGS
ncbi:hypothetical protein [Lyngbya confervoides]|uniref:ATP synthase F0 subunit B n=1 Tax=Lyngbya confervoides BDU141951 TaxID=1574623 RepID=A0ABD4T2B4_9CYAN|nr:hypothetical protein [Lyngbya confervoides]MCM1982643.1 hypothetical protein [Lyngbya confervoides BDU141951]